MAFDISFIAQQYPEILGGIFVTLIASLAAIVAGILGGLIGGAIRVRQVPFLASAIAAYVDLIRNTPFPVQLFFLYFGLPNVGIVIPGLACGILGLTMLGIAHASEVFRAGLRGVPPPVIMAAHALAMPNRDIFRYVELPIALRSIVRPLTGTAILIFKESSVLYLISVHELLYTTVNIASVHFRSPEMISVMGIFYLGGGLLIAAFGALWERKLKISHTV